MDQVEENGYLNVVQWTNGFGNALIKTTPPYHKISYMKIDDTPPQSQVISYSKCRAKTGDKSKYIGSSLGIIISS